jgi:predicted deacylase
MSQRAGQSPLPRFEVRLRPPDIDPWRDGNTGIPGFTTLRSGVPGPHVAVLAVTHGNEIAGAIVADKLLRAAIRPARGQLTFGFVNIAAFDRFDPQHPTISRFVDEDINRLWDIAVLESAQRSCELDRARQIRPLIDTVDVLLDLHSTLWPSDPLILSGPSEKGRRLALGIGIPATVVADAGHANGRRIIDYERFVDPATTATANLVEAGQHWEEPAAEMALASVAGLLRHVGTVQDCPILPAVPPARPCVATVTEVVIARTGQFAFVQPYRGGEVIAQRDTLIATDGTTEIRTPHDDCMLVMPSLRPSRGHTAVRLARFANTESG